MRQVHVSLLNFHKNKLEIILSTFEMYKDRVRLINFIYTMEDKKVLGEFHAKISKAKILYDTTSATNQKLRR